ncbi:hypothetical protein FOQG_06346 [Fusarium oxysporum f. sp. raphani 54005]|uniref:Uncharacterized protein n=2 Tax=Fusarium oxysporum TaxID=5507 RepID=X0CBV5_FUSOX|nr:hypothetical protein FOVG_08469 [Fusarium oxysporum f. sp. pisi HDV247]EXK91631.1 hypothetical protein FOQG_06346 [Fusarium oxysporum f. sp. raphani 54005]
MSTTTVLAEQQVRGHLQRHLFKGPRRDPSSVMR